MSSLTNNELDAPPWLRVESTLMATARLVREAFDARLASLDLNLTQASLLGYVAEFGATTQTRLADHLGIGRAAIGTIIDQLQRRGLVERCADPGDRRVWRVDITGAGREMAGAVADIDEVLRAELRHGIGREERQALSWVLTRLQQNLRSAIDRSCPSADQPAHRAADQSIDQTTVPTTDQTINHTTDQLSAQPTTGETQ